MPNLDYYKTRFSFNKNRDKVWKEIARYLQRYIKKESVILDLGAGYCTFINNINAKEKHALDAYNGFEKYAEKNAIAFAAAEGVATKGAILVCTDSPCMDCATLIKQSKIKEVYYEKEYRDLQPIEFLRENNVKVEKI